MILQACTVDGQDSIETVNVRNDLVRSSGKFRRNVLTWAAARFLWKTGRKDCL